MKRFLAAGLLALVAAAPAQAQQTETLELQIDEVDQSDFPEVVVTVTVPTEMVSLDLAPENFFIGLDGRRVNVDTALLPPEELQIALLVDTSGSMNGAPINAARTAVQGFVEAMPSGVEMSLVGFGESVEVIVPFTTESDDILGGVSQLRAGGETALYDGLIEAVSGFGQEAGKRRTVVLLSDGGDTVSDADLESAIVAVIGSEARLIMVELESPESDRAALERLRTAAEGSLVSATDPEALAAIYAEAASDLTNQYELTFESTARGNTDLLVAIRTEELVAQGEVIARFPLPATPSTTVPGESGPGSTAPLEVTTPIIETAAVPVDVNVPWYASFNGLMVGAAAVFAALSLIFVLLAPTRRGAMAVMGNLAGLGDRAALGRGRFSELTNRATLFAEDRLTRGGRERKLRMQLDQAGLALREGEFFLLVLSAAIVAGVIGQLVGGVLVAAALALGAVIAAFAVVRWLGDRRANAFRLQLPDSLQLISGSLRAGFGLNQAITAVADEQDAPAGEEFARAQLEVHLGRDIEEALRTMAVRTQSEDLPWVAEAIEIHREIGGDIADLLDQIAVTVRERERIRGQIQVLSAEGRISGVVLVLLPFVIAGLTFSVAPEYLGTLTSSTPGRVMLAGGAAAMLIGIFWIRRIVRLEF